MLKTKRATPKHLVRKRDAKVTSRVLFIGPPSRSKTGLNEDITDEDLEEYFHQFGRVVRVKQLKRNGKKRGFGIIEFTDEDAVDKAVIIRHHLIKEIRLEASKPKLALKVIDRKRPEKEEMSDDTESNLQIAENTYKAGIGARQGLSEEMNVMENIAGIRQFMLERKLQQIE